MARVDVSDEHLWQILAFCESHFRSFRARGRGVAALLASGNSDWGAVHIEFAVADAVQPAPGEGVLTWSDAAGNLEMENTSAVSVGVSRKIAIRRRGAASFNGMDNLPDRFFVRDRILSERELARSTTMHGAPDEAQGLCLTNGVDVFRGHYASAGSVRLAKLAREISSTGIERTIVQRTGVEWSGRANLHMSIDGACRQQSRDSSHKFRGKLHG